MSAADRGDTDVVDAATTQMGDRGQPDGVASIAAGWRERIRRALPLIVLGVAAVIAAIVATPDTDSGLPLDPASVGGDGTAALVRLLERFDVDVDVIDPDAATNAPVVVVLRDQLVDGDRRRLRRHVRSGARLVVADPDSVLSPTPAGALSPLDVGLTRGCAVTALDGVDQISPRGLIYELPDDATGCFAVDDQPWLVIRAEGRGHVVSLGGPGVLTNAELGQADHAALAVSLLTPRGTTHVAIVRPVVRVAGDGGLTLTDLITAGPRAFGVQLLITFGLVVAWRARRLGRPLSETTPVRLASSDLTSAVGALLARHGGRGATAERIAVQVRRRLASMLGLSSDAPVDQVAAAVATRAGWSLERVTVLLGGGGGTAQPPDDTTLLRRIDELTALERAVANVVRPPPDTAAEQESAP